MERSWKGRGKERSWKGRGNGRPWEGRGKVVACHGSVSSGGKARGARLSAARAGPLRRKSGWVGKVRGKSDSTCFASGSAAAEVISTSVA